MLLKRSQVFIILFAIAIPCSAQVEKLHSFWKTDTSVQNKFLRQTLQKKELYIKSAGKEFAKDYEMVYENHMERIAGVWESSRPVTDPQVHQYMQQLVQKIIKANPELKDIDARVVFVRDDWPNATSMGDGTIVINGGLVIFLNNEAELVFTICHELAHYYLDHSNKTIKRLVEKYNSKEFQDELKRISKEEYRVGQQLESFMKKMTFNTRQHSREHEAEADRYAFRFMKNTGYDLGGIKTCLELFMGIDEASYYNAFVPEKTFHFSEYPFKRKWVEKKSALFSQLKNEESALSQQEKDSLKTHPDCAKRIEWLEDSIQAYQGGEKFLVNEEFFHRLKRSFFPEMTELHWEYDNLAKHLYYNLLMLQNNEYRSLAIYNIARDLNVLFERQKDHRLGDMDKENRFYNQDYNFLLRMIDRWKLDEIASINYYFCKQYQQEMKEHEIFRKEMEKAARYMKESTIN